LLAADQSRENQHRFPPRAPAEAREGFKLAAHVQSQNGRKVVSVLSYALIFLIIALVAAILGFGGIAVAAAGVAKILFFIFIVFFLVTLVMHLARRV